MDPVVKSITVHCAPATAFNVFTSGMGLWWPLKSHSVFGEEALTCECEPRAGGRVYEKTRGGGEALWGTVMLADPGRRLMMTWHPGRPPTTAQMLSLTFLGTSGGTRIDLEHSGWDALGNRAKETRAPYVTGWDEVLGRCFADCANRADAHGPLADPK